MNREEMLNPEFDIEPQDLQKLLAQPSDFAYRGEDKDVMFKTWSLGPVIEHRDSDILTQSNAAALVKLLESEPAFKDEWHLSECGHWAVGWVKHLSFKAIADDGTATRIARVIMNFYHHLKNEYPIADEDDYSERRERELFANVARQIEFLRSTDKIADDEIPEGGMDLLGWRISDRYSGSMNEDSDGAECPEEYMVLDAIKWCKAHGWTRD